MKISDGLALRVAAVARRVAVSVALRHVEAEERGADFSDSARIALGDDLCGLSFAVDAANVSDMSLACAAADPDRGASLAARVAYAARLHLRSAALVVPSTEGLQPQPSSSLRYQRLREGLKALRNRGADCVLGPRPLLGSLAHDTPEMRDVLLLRLVACGQAVGTDELARVLSREPFFIEPAELAVALDGHPGSPRDALAAAISKLAGVKTRERAIAALDVLDAVLESAASSNALARGLGAARTAIAAFAPAWVADGALLDACVNATDWILETASPSTKAGERALMLGDALACAESCGVRIVPYVGSFEAGGTIGFERAPSSPLDIVRFARAAGCEALALEASCAPSPRALVVGSIENAIADELVESLAAIAGRSVPGPDADSAVISPGMTFSASRLNGFVKCPRRFFFQYLCEAVEDPGSIHATYGRVVHDALEMLHREIRMPARHEPAFILERMLRALDAAFGVARADFASQLEYESSRWRARRMAEQYVRWLVAEAKRAPMEIAAVEVFERRQLGDHDFVGYIDRLDRPEGGGPVTIYDYKTGRIESDAGSYLDKVRAGEEAQLALYYAMRRAAGDDIKRIALVSIRDPKDDVWILALDLVADGAEPARVQREDGVVRATCSPADLDASLAALLKRCDLLARDGVLRFVTGDDPPCGFCEYARACRERPLEGERAFAR